MSLFLYRLLCTMLCYAIHAMLLCCALLVREQWNGTISETEEKNKKTKKQKNKGGYVVRVRTQQGGIKGVYTVYPFYTPFVHRVQYSDWKTA